MKEDSKKDSEIEVIKQLTKFPNAFFSQWTFIEEFDPQPAVTYWSRQRQQRPSFRKEKHFPTDEDESQSELEISDIEVLKEDTDGELSLSNEDNESSNITI